MKFEPVDPKVATPALHKFELTNPRKRFYKIAPCVLDSATCSHSSRIQGKANHPQTFNSVVQIESKFFKNRNLDNQLKKKSKHFEKKFINTGESRNISVDNGKAMAHSPPQSQGDQGSQNDPGSPAKISKDKSSGLG